MSVPPNFNFQFNLCRIHVFYGQQIIKFDPILVQLTHFVTGVSSNNIMYALVAVNILKNLQLAKVSGLYFQNCLFWTDLVQILPKFCPVWAI